MSETNSRDKHHRTVTEMFDRTSGEDGVSFTVRVLQGPDRGLSPVLDANKPLRALVGHGPVCEIQLSDPNVSRRHAALEVIRGELRVTDLASAHGTFVDGVRVVDAFLRGGEVLQVGTTQIHVERREAAARGGPLASATSFGATLGASVAMRRLYPLCERLAASGVPLIIEGEAGTGKEVLAESIHRASSQRSGPFVVFDCGAAPAHWTEVELCGDPHDAGAGASPRRRGLIEQAEGGTLFINDIGDLDMTLQSALLRALESQERSAAGADRSARVPARIIGATRQDLDREVEHGRFRDDLLRRLAVGRIELPPLRARIDDVRLLSKSFCHELGGDSAGIPEDVAARWDAWGWPGNVRELRDAVARWLAQGETSLHPESGSRLRAGAAAARFDALVDEMLAHRLPLADARQRLVDAFDATYIEQQFRENGNHVGRAAAASGIGKRYFQMLRARHRAR